MGANIIVVTVDGNKYKIEKNGISDFALIGVLECILADLKIVSRQGGDKSGSKEAVKVNENTVVDSGISPVGSRAEETITESAESKLVETISAETSSPDIRSRIINARQAIRGLKGEVDEADLNAMTEEELQEEFEALTAQYKRLKNSQVNKKR